MIRKIIKTLQGDHTIFVPDLNEHYHSTGGAIEEAQHVYIDNGLNQLKQKQITVLEVGFGTGLNAFLTAIYAKNNSIDIFYTTLEKFPLPESMISELNYADFFADEKPLYSVISKCQWAVQAEIHPYFHLTKTEADIHDITLPDNAFDLIFYDAFAPDKQPEMWTESLMQKMYNCLKPNGILSTYTANGLVKQNLRNAGFTVKRLKGAGQKRHMINAVKMIE